MHATALPLDLRSWPAARDTGQPPCMASPPGWSFAPHAARGSPGWRAHPARGDRSRSPRAPLAWEARVPLPSDSMGRTRSGRPRSWPPVRRRGPPTLRGLFLLALSAEGLHVVATADIDQPAGISGAPRRQRFILTLTPDELSVIAALRYAAGDLGGSWDVSSARCISLSSGDES